MTRREDNRRRRRRSAVKSGGAGRYCRAAPPWRCPQPEPELLTDIRQVVADQPTYGYGRLHAPIRRDRDEQGGTAVNVKRVSRVMKAHGILPTATGGPQETPNGLSQRDNQRGS
jgi:hypothetical protein